MYSLLIQTAFVAFGVSILFSPLAGKLACKFGIIDKPDGDRKFHRQSLPLAGGIVVMVSMLIAAAFPAYFGFLPIAEFLPLISAMSVIVVVGVVDDRFALRSRRKLLGQCLAVAILVGGGFKFAGLGVMGVHLDLGILELPIMAILLLATINAFNFLDGADGFAASVGLVTSLVLCVLALYSGKFFEATIAAGLTGALLGFLAFNFPPARMFLGDSGSMLIGLVVGCLVFRVGTPQGEPVPVGVAISLLALPFLDMCAAIARRKLTGRSMASADRAHLHHCLLRNGFGPRRMVAAAVVFCAIPAFGAFVVVVTRIHIASWFSMLMLGTVLVSSRSFGSNELKLVIERIFGRHRRSGFNDESAKKGQVRIGLQHSAECREFWLAMTDFAADHDLSRVTLHLSGSWMDDGLDVFWESTKPSQGTDNWCAKLPVFSNGRLFGHVEISGAVDGNCGQHILGPLGELIESKVPCIDRLFVDVAKRAVARQLGEKNRVLFINRSYWPDCEATGQLLTELCEELGSDFDVSVLVGQPNHMTHEQSYRATGVQCRNNVDIYRIPHTTFGKGSMLGKAMNLLSFTAFALWRVFWIPKHEVVVVETDPFLLALVGGIVKKFRGGKLIIYMQDVYPDVATAIGKVSNGFVSKVTASLMQRACRYADKIVVLGDDMKRRIQRHGIAENKIALIPNWTDPKIVFPVKTKNAFRRENNLDDKFVIMHSGNMGLTQELGQIVEVASQLQHRDDIEFVFVGNGASRPRLENLVQQQNLNNVRFFPYQPREELAISLSAANLHLVSMHPNITGCLVPSKLYGIMASGTPVLAVVPEDTDVWSIVRSEQIGVAVRPGEISAIRGAIECCADGDLDLESMGQRARELVESRYNLKQGSQLFAAVLDEFVERRLSRETSLKTSGASAIPAPHSPQRVLGHSSPVSK